MATVNKYLFLLAALAIGLGMLSVSGSAFEFNGTTLLPNGTAVNGTNITVSIYSNTSNADNVFNPTYSWTAYSNQTGFFNFSGTGGKSGGAIMALNDTHSLLFKIEMRWHGGVTPWTNATCNYTGPLIAPVPANVIVNQLSNSTFYLTEAVNINITAQNSTAANANLSFRGLIYDDKLGIIVDDFSTNTSNAKWAVLPYGRNYTVVMWTDVPDWTNGWIRSISHFVAPQIIYLNNYTNRSWPMYVNATLNATTTTPATLYTVNGTLSMWNPNDNTSKVNYTSVVAYPFIPSTNLTLYDVFLTNLTGEYEGIHESNFTIGAYNITLPGSSTWIIAGYGNDTTSTYYGGFRNVTVGTANLAGINITLKPMAGGYHTGGGMNMTKTMFQFVDGETVSGVTNLPINGTVRVKVTTLYNGTQLHWSTQTNASGWFAMPLWNDTDVTITAFNNRFAPQEIVVTSANLSQRAYINLTLRELNVRDPDVVGTYSTTVIDYIHSNKTCNVPHPVPGCKAKTYSGLGGYSPANTSFGGANMSVRMTYGPVVHYSGIDLTSTGPPDAQFDSTPSTSSTATTYISKWRIGSLAPSDVYDWILVGLPYADSDYDDSGLFTITLEYLYNDDWTVLWNTTADGYYPNTTLEDYANYNTTWFSGMTCDRNVDTRINTTQSCYMNTTSNFVWMYLPHFSGMKVSMVGSKATATAAAISGGTGGGGGTGVGATSTYWSSIDAGDETTMNVVGIPSLAASAITFTLSKDATAVRMTVEALSDIPTSITDNPPGTVYKYFDITATNIDATNLESAIIKFIVTKDWITENNVNINTIRLARYTDIWEVLDTSYTGEDSVYVHFEAETPGFSTFVIIAETMEGEVITAPVTEKPGLPTLEIPEELKKPANLAVLGALILVIVGLGYLFTRKKKPVPARAGRRRRRRTY